MLILSLTPGCRPTDAPAPEPAAGSQGSRADPARPEASPADPGSEEARGREEAALGTLRLEAMPPSPALEPPPDADAAVGGSPSAEPDAPKRSADAWPPPVELPEELARALAIAPSPEAEREAKRLNQRALRRHRKLELEAAVGLYREALEAWPGHPFSRYNLGCALALLGRKEAALRELEVLAALGDDASLWRLRRARVDEDFVDVRDDPSFRRLTSYVPVEVSWSPTLEGDSAGEELVRSLRKGQIPARLGAAAADAAEGTTIRHRPGEAAITRIVEELSIALPVEAKIVEDPGLTVDRPVVVVLGSGAADRATPAPSDFVGRPLEARPEGALERLHLKTTGFVRWERIEESGARVTRTGRYHLEGKDLSLDVREVSEQPGPDGAPDDLTVLQGKRSHHLVETREGALVVDGLEFRPRR